MGKLDGKVAIVTGSSRGIGKAVAIEFARQGACVAIAARTEEPLKSGLAGTILQTVDEIKAFGGKALPVKTNILVEDEVLAMAQRVLDEWGKIDILVNNAAASDPRKFWEHTTKRWNLVIGVNLTGMFLCTQAVLPTMMKQKSGSIINTSAGSAASGMAAPVPGAGVSYVMTKEAIERFTYALAAELYPYNIAVNCYKPLRGVASEGMVFNWPPGYRSPNSGGPEKMVKAALFLAQQDDKGMTGCVAYDEEYILRYRLGD